MLNSVLVDMGFIKKGWAPSLLLIIVIGVGSWVFTHPIATPGPDASASVSLALTPRPASTTTLALTTSSGTNPLPIEHQIALRKSIPLIKIATTSTSQVVRIQNPYNSSPLPPETINVRARAALVNILCAPRGGGSLSPISGSGVIIDSQGVILTNAHVGQYVLLSEVPEIDLSCTVRTGAPANAHWRARVLYISPSWVKKHALQLNEHRPIGSGEDDYALLIITDSITGAPLPQTFSYLPIDPRPHIAFLDDPILIATYPAEFVGGLVTQQNLYPASSFSTVQQFFTFGTGSVDLFSVGGVIEAQGGSSGGAVVNMWGYLVGIISTTSEGSTTAARDLRALSTNYIDTRLSVENGKNLALLLASNLADELLQFEKTQLPSLAGIYLSILKR